MRDAWSLARLNLVRRPMAFALLAALVALAAAAYLGTGAFAAEVLVAIEPRLELGLGGLVLARLECWAYSQTRYVNDPTRVDKAIAIRRHLVLADQGPLGVAFRPPRGIGGGHGEAATRLKSRGGA